MEEEINESGKIYAVSSPKELALSIAEILDRKLAEDIKVLHVTEKTIIADYFVIATGRSSTQIRALEGDVEFEIEKSGLKVGHIEGYSEANWICMDYHSVIVHIFNKENRDLYRIEKLWDDAEEIDISDVLTER
ncbi:MAG: ribosome silencing factor [Firmicutes bacterium]|nr:ribosome silencing factor [Bacillota bacterium]MCD7943627.1 ribosome silencing factor [Clostridia bacterium]MCD8056666.1 ribosome silencing factor [Clostridiales bacterium]MCD7747602.1 ribosome silencing factor [Bacillota bacterium]MCD7783706.1 ribosome silencing factor [Bacillota bacterium]